MQIKTRLLSVLAVGCACHLLAATSSAAILQRWDFEGADPFRGLTLEGEKPRVIQDPVNPSNHVMEAVLLRSSERQERSEVRWDRIGYGVERWVAVRIRVPDRNPSMRVLFQVGPIKNPNDAQSKGWIQLQAPADSEEWINRIFLERIQGPRVRTSLGPMVLGAWETWVMHFRLADDDKGFIEIWRGGKKVYDGKGPNARPRDVTLLKWGIYIGIGNRLKQDSRVLYDDVMLGDENSSYQEVTTRR